jgi:chromatin segregation and condensation protein Rec8/ScpA/Scc1 (kleisin family)
MIKNLKKKNVERKKCDWANRWKIKETKREKKTRRAKKKNEIHETKKIEHSWKRIRRQTQKKKKSNESIHFQTFNYENKTANTMRMFVKLWLIKYWYFWCKTRTTSIDDNEFSVWDFSDFSTHSFRFLHLNLRLMKIDA